MSAGSIGGVGLGTTAVLGTKIVRSGGEALARTGGEAVRVLAMAAAGAGSIATGLILRGKGKKVQAGEPLD